MQKFSHITVKLKFNYSNERNAGVAVAVIFLLFFVGNNCYSFSKKVILTFLVH